MAIQKPSIPKGTRDFSPLEVNRRQYIINTIKKQFVLFGFSPIETPSFENLSTLTGKYGEEGDRLIFKILDSGDYMKLAKEFIEVSRKIDNHLKESKTLKIIDNDTLAYDTTKLPEFIEWFNKQYSNYNKIFNGNIWNEIFNNGYDFKDYILEKYFFNSQKLTNEISEKALRYDLTVPFARYVVQHQNEITFPFKRYQIQPVWRADRPQKGRFREFFQCDADVVGSDSLLQEVDFVQLYDSVFTELKTPVEIHINNRKILSGLAEVADISAQLIDFTVALDKLDKIGEEAVKEEMRGKGISDSAIEILSPLFSMNGDYKTQFAQLKEILKSSETGLKGIEELEFVFENTTNIGLQSADLILNLTLARGLDYYTGAIFEVKAKIGEFSSSIGGGGRYDDLTGIFGLPGISGVGISFGLDRTYLVLEENNLFPALEDSTNIQALFINFGTKEAAEAMKLVKQLRQSGINTEVYPDDAKMKKQMGYADKKGIKKVILLGEKEIAEQKATVKDMILGEQTEVAFVDLANALFS